MDHVLSTARGCLYLGMKRHSKPLCFDGGNQNNISDDSSLDTCQVKKKREDNEWSEWVGFEQDNITDWYEAEERNCSNEVSHGGLQRCSFGVKQVHYLRWFKWVKYTTRDFNSAQKYCEDVSGELFHNFGSELVPGFPHWSEQIMFLMRHMMSNESGYQKLNTFWIAYKTNAERDLESLKIFDIDGKHEQKLQSFWNDNHDTREGFVVILGDLENTPMYKAVQDIPGNRQQYFVCFITDLTVTVSENL